MAQNKAFRARFNGTCKRCGNPIVADEHWIYLFNLPKPKTAYHSDCQNPAVSPYTNASDVPNVEEKDDAPTLEPIPVPAVPSNGHATSVEQAIRDLVQTIAPKPQTIDSEAIRDQVNTIAKEEIRKLVVPQNITIKLDNREIRLEGIKPHKTFATLLDLILSGENVYLYGDPGWGKSQAVSDAAKALERPFGFTSLTLQTSDTRLTGFYDGHGNYHATPLREMFENGGIFCVDEVDRANGNTLTALNNMLANGHGQFPDKNVTRSKDFGACATGNTTGIGANPNFPDCRPLDMAFRDRFFFLEWDEDLAFERTIALGINSQSGSWVDWVQAVRSFIKSNNLRLVVSPRSTYKGALHLGRGSMSTETIANGVLFRGIARETVTRILAAHPYPEFSFAAKAGAQ